MTSQRKIRNSVFACLCVRHKLKVGVKRDNRRTDRQKPKTVSFLKAGRLGLALPDPLPLSASKNIEN